MCFNNKGDFNSLKDETNFSICIRKIVSCREHINDLITPIIQACNSGYERVTYKLIILCCDTLCRFKHDENYIDIVNNFTIPLIDKFINEVDAEKKDILEYFLRLAFRYNFTEMYDIILNKYKNQIDLTDF